VGVDNSSEMVVLVDDDGNDIGQALKSEVHTTDTPLHRAFSIHLFNDRGEVLITRRALGKKTWPGVWTNAVCGHPGPGEDTEDAIVRRVADEIGAAVTDISVVLPDFRYRAVDASGIVENEICPVFVGKLTSDPNPAESEVAEWQWVSPEKISTGATATPFAFSPWFVLQLEKWPKPYGY
jgi:isopentenyl-diphosphate delta-isomerase